MDKPPKACPAPIPRSLHPARCIKWIRDTSCHKPARRNQKRTSCRRDVSALSARANKSGTGRGAAQRRQ
jgi:hypothetical protein